MGRKKLSEEERKKRKLESLKKYREKNRELLRQKNKEYRKNNPEKSSNSSINWAKNNSEKVKNIKKKYRETHLQQVKQEWIEYYKENKDKIRNNYLKRNFDITTEIYEKMLLEQNGSCAICFEKAENERNGRLVVDHCHKTGDIRKLLCNKCNMALGLLKDNVEIFRVTSGSKKTDNALKLLEKAVYNINKKMFIKTQSLVSRKRMGICMRHSKNQKELK
jgi:hypothetical protein